MSVVVGCDVSKLWVDVCCLDGLKVRTQRVANEPEQLRGWARSLPGVCRVGMEATGSFHLELACALVQAGHTVMDQSALDTCLCELCGAARQD
jgi:transposase